MEYWAKEGHQVHVVTSEPTVLGLEEPHSPLISVDRSRDPLEKTAAQVIEGARTNSRGSPKQVALSGLGSIAKTILWPDRFVLWSAKALVQQMKLPWKPDVVVVSVRPVSALVPAWVVSRRFRSPLVVDYRDLQSDRRVPGDRRVSPRRWLTSRLEKGITSRASLIAGVTQPMVELLGKKTGVETVVVTNGYEPRDFEDWAYSPTDDGLTIRYVGTIYPGLSDPSPLFRAIRLLRDRGKDPGVRVEFLGSVSPEVKESVDSLDLADCVEFLGRVTHAEAVRAQVEADLLLLLFWDHPHERGVLTGKIFEYIGARRPILCMGLEEGEQFYKKVFEAGLVDKDRQIKLEYEGQTRAVLQQLIDYLNSSESL